MIGRKRSISDFIQLTDEWGTGGNNVNYVKVMTPGLAMSLQNYCGARETGHGKKGSFYLWPLGPLDLQQVHRQMAFQSDMTGSWNFQSASVHDSWPKICIRDRSRNTISDP